MAPVSKLSDSKLFGSKTIYTSMLAGNPVFVDASFDLLETTVVSGTAVASVEFTNLTTKYASTYQHLQIRAASQSTSSSDLYMQVNNVTSAGAYSTHYIYGFNNSVASTTVSNDKLYVGVSGTTGTDAPTGATVLDILDAFETTKNKTIRSFNGRAGGTNPIIMLASGARLSTDSITSIKLFQVIGNVNIGSRISLYGVK